jgi:hypothetical protein
MCEGVQSQRDIAGDHILFQLGLEVAGIISLDDTVNGAVNRFKKQFVNFHAKSKAVVIEIRGAIIRVVNARTGDGSKQPQVRAAGRILRVFTGEENDHRMAQHGGLERFENGVRAQRTEKSGPGR